MGAFLVNGHSTCKRLASALRAAGFQGDIEQDSALLAAMSTDNSVYQIYPDLVVAPSCAQDLVTLLRVVAAPEYAHVAITARGGGTGTNGQSLNTGVIIDLRRHMSQLIELDVVDGWADVQPGMVLDDLNEQIRNTGWFFAPETSTSTRCTIGGMVSTDASGKGSRVYGKTSDNLLGLEVARPEGLLFSCDPVADWAAPMLAAAETAVRQGRDAFVAVMPNLNRRFTGYDLERACPVDSPFEWWRLFPGAEGTLGLISRIRVKLTRIEPEKRLIVAVFDSLRNALSAAMPLAQANPTAVEVMDERVQSLANEAGLLSRLPDRLQQSDSPVAYVFIEINDLDARDAASRVEGCAQILAALEGCDALHVAVDHQEIRELWGIRSAAVGLLGKIEGHARPVAFVEDTVVPPHNLPKFLDEFLELLVRENVIFGIYGHVDVGCLHIRPALNIDSRRDREKMQRISDGVYALTCKYDGIFWGEHGKGIRGAYLRDWVGADVYRAFQGVKSAFDPSGRYNPGKLVTKEDDVLGITTTPFRVFNAPDGHVLEKAYRCNGNAQCLSYAASTTMCPSFKATSDLRQSPKGRADALRDWHEAKNSTDVELGARETDLLGVLDTCLGCKACKSSCPVQVDIPTMRTAFYADYYSRNRRPLADRLTLAAERFSPLALRFAPCLSLVWPIASRVGQALTASTDLPVLSAYRPGKGDELSERDLSKPLPDKSVILVQDWFTALFDDEAVQDALAGLTALGYRPFLLVMRPSGKAALNAGDMAGFYSMANRLKALLDKAAATKAPLVAFEPSFGMMLRQDYSDLDIVLPKVRMVQEFLQDELAAGHTFPRLSPSSATLLSHCSEATSMPSSRDDWKVIFSALGIDLKTPETGCCGMAGLFGHQNRHQTVSKRLFDLSWRNRLKSSDVVLATGFSCRSQTLRLSGHIIRHPLGYIAQLLQSRSNEAPVSAARNSHNI